MQVNSSAISRQHVPALDGLRGLAILLVMLHHFESVLPGGNKVADIIKGVIYAGWSGVDLFFVLSGFLITGILIDTKRTTNYFSSFYARRILRIFPLYYSVLTVIVVLARIFYQPWMDNVMAIRPDHIYYFLYLDNWLVLLHDTWHANIIGHFWSLAVEEQFYLIWPMCVWLVPERHLAKLAVCGCGFALLFRFVLVSAYGPSPAIILNTFARMDALLAGACCAMVVRRGHLMYHVRPWLLPAIILALVSVLWIDLFHGETRSLGSYTQTVGYSFWALGYAALLLRLVSDQGGQSILQKICRVTWLRAMGKYSYGLYTFHVPILMVYSLLFGPVLKLGVNPWTSIVFFVFLFVISFVVAKMSYELFEQRFLRMKNRFEPRFQPLPEASPALSQAPI